MRAGGPRIHKVSCPCGTSLAVDPRDESRSVTCSHCGGRLDFVVTLDARSKRAKVSIVVPPAAVAAPKGGPPPPVLSRPSAESVPPPAGRVQAPCSCGATMLVDGEELTSLHTCRECGTTYHVVIKLEPDTREKKAILVPKDPFARRKTMVPRTPPPSADRAGGTRVRPEAKARTRVAPPASSRKAKAPPGPPPPGTLEVRCVCGARCFVRRKEVNRDISCPGCGATLHIQETRDPQTLAPRLQATVVPKNPPRT